MTAPSDAQRAWKSGQMRRRPTTPAAAPVVTRVELPTVMPAPRPAGRPKATAPPRHAIPAGVDLSDGLCRQTDPELWHPEKGSTNTDAKAICGRCPVRRGCLDDALDSGIRYGVWGGLSDRERQALIKRQVGAA